MGPRPGLFVLVTRLEHKAITMTLRDDLQPDGKPRASESRRNRGSRVARHVELIRERRYVKRILDWHTGYRFGKPAAGVESRGRRCRRQQEVEPLKDGPQGIIKSGACALGFSVALCSHISAGLDPGEERAPYVASVLAQ